MGNLSFEGQGGGGKDALKGWLSLSPDRFKPEHAQLSANCPSGAG
jgi:hypothetical protein